MKIHIIKFCKSKIYVAYRLKFHLIGSNTYITRTKKLNM